MEKFISVNCDCLVLVIVIIFFSKPQRQEWNLLNQILLSDISCSHYYFKPLTILHNFVLMNINMFQSNKWNWIWDWIEVIRLSFDSTLNIFFLTNMSRNKYLESFSFTNWIRINIFLNNMKVDCQILVDFLLKCSNQ